MSVRWDPEREATLKRLLDEGDLGYPAIAGRLGTTKAAIVSGVVTFIVAMWFAHKGKSIGFGVFVGISIFALGISAYKTWLDEYVKNVGAVEVQFFLPSLMSVGQEIVEMQITIINTTSDITIFREIGLGRVRIVDQSANMIDQVSPHCKEMNMSPQGASHIAEASGPSEYAIEGGGRFSYMKVSEISENRSFPIIIEPGRAQVLRIKFQGAAIDKAQFNGVALCPSVVYLKKNREIAAAICEGSTMSVMFGGLPPMRTGPDTLRFEVFPALETTHCRSIFP